ncbi:unnamed protein product [Mucor circinelloides]|uniref:N-acetyltransferase domain-containing protein n=1 Tax=Mucor circinelloides f. circinelloides (strain 1006PhL) TaxID=1220926 RepID=S2J9U2_MUCC1|nr:hypothetical protein HMPREF1544_06776 [Mucor circinelloides 1006PhL]
MPVATIRKYVLARGKIDILEEFASQNEWILSDALVHEQEQDYPVNCISVYYAVDLQAKQITDKYFVATYHPKYKDTFKEVSVAWLEEYFSVEENDLVQLDTPEENIIAPGGEIFTLLNAKDNIGVVAMLDHGATTELGKMGVKKQYLGKGLAHPLMFEAIKWAKTHDKKFPHIDIYTAKHLTPAINLYRKYGFEDCPIGNYTKFTRVDLAMRLTF